MKRNEAKERNTDPQDMYLRVQSKTSFVTHKTAICLPVQNLICVT